MGLVFGVGRRINLVIRRRRCSHRISIFFHPNVWEQGGISIILRYLRYHKAALRSLSRTSQFPSAVYQLICFEIPDTIDWRGSRWRPRPKTTFLLFSRAHAGKEWQSPNLVQQREHGPRDWEGKDMVREYNNGHTSFSVLREANKGTIFSRFSAGWTRQKIRGKESHVAKDCPDGYFSHTRTARGIPRANGIHKGICL